MRKRAVLISAFPGCGKSTFYNKYSVYSESQEEQYKDCSNCKILDSDSSQFSWIWKDGQKTNERNPEFPANYIEHIKENMLTQDIIFISTHESVRNALKEAGLEYTLIYPDGSLKEEWIRRFKERGSSDGFIQTVEENWDTWIDQMEEETSNKIVLETEDDTLEMAIINKKIWEPKSSLR